MPFATILQITCALGLLTLAGVILRLVYLEKISDKYGIGWLALLTALSAWNFSINWFFYASAPAGVLFLVLGLGFMSLVVSFSIQLTEYSRARRKAVQDLALMRRRYEDLLEKATQLTPEENTLRLN